MADSPGYSNMNPLHVQILGISKYLGYPVVNKQSISQIDQIYIICIIYHIHCGHTNTCVGKHIRNDNN